MREWQKTKECEQGCMPQIKGLDHIHEMKKKYKIINLMINDSWNMTCS